VKHADKANCRKVSKTSSARAVFSAMRAPLQKLVARRRQMNADIKDLSYFGVSPKDVKLDSKTQTSTSLAGREMMLIEEEIKVMRAALQAAVGTKGFDARLWYKPNDYNSGTGAMSLSISLNPVACPEWATFALLFDLYRVREVIAHYRTMLSDRLASAAPPTAATIAAVSYTPIAVTLYTSIPQLCDDAKHHLYPIDRTSIAAQGTTDIILCGSSELHSFRMKMPAPGIVSTVATTTPGDWHPTSDTTDIEGYFNLFCPGTSNTDITSSVIYEYVVEFRCRD